MSPRRNQFNDHESYRPRPDTSQLVPAQEALFTFPDAPDAYDNTLNGPAQPDSASAPTPVEWPHIKLADAAVALEGIMKGYNRRSRADGIDTIRNTPDNRFDTLYTDRADEIDANADYKAERQEDEKAKHMAVLADAERMKAVFGPEATQWYSNRAEDYLDGRYGPGGRRAKIRANLVKSVKKLAGQ